MTRYILRKIHFFIVGVCWHNMQKVKPSDGQRVLVYDFATGHFTTATYRFDYGPKSVDDDCFTHWIELRGPLGFFGKEKNRDA